MSNRITKRKILLFALLIALIAALVGGVGLLAGGRARVHGYSGTIVMSAEVQEDGSFRLQIDRHKEDYGLGSIALARVVDAVNEQQNLDVDLISGATETSAAALECARKALENAGIDTGSLQGTESGGGEGFVDYSCDVVVVGAGGAGLTAALSAAQNGSQVIVVEKMGMAGGSTVRSEGMLMAAGTELQAYNGVRDGSASFSSFLYGLCDPLISRQNRIVTLSEHSADNLKMLEDLGVRFSDTLLRSADGVARVHVAVDPNGNAGGGAIVQPLLNACEEAGVQFVYNSEVYELIRDISGSVIGVRAEQTDGGVLTVWAKSVILATGGYDRSDVLLKTYNPGGGTPAYSYSSPGNTGDGIRLADQADAMILDGSLIAELHDFYAGTNDNAGLLVTPRGKRFADESRSALQLGSAIQQEGYSWAWLILDSRSAHSTALQNGIEQGYVLKADTIEELGQAMAAPSLPDTVSRYNAACESGVDNEFGKAAEYLKTVGAGPYYAVKYQLKSYGTMGGIRTATTGQVMGEVTAIPGLYACGEAANGVCLSGTFPGFGASLAQVIESGRIAGLSASEYAAQDHSQEVFVTVEEEEDAKTSRR